MITTLPPATLHPDGRLTFSLPLPHRGVGPNASVGHSRGAAMRKAKLVKEHVLRAKTYLRIALFEVGITTPPIFAGYSLVFHFGCQRRRDDDNADASFKPYRDGIAQLLGVDDSTLRKLALSEHRIDRQRPRLEVTLHPPLITPH